MPQPYPGDTGHAPPSISATSSGPGTAPTPSLGSDPGAESARRLGAQPKASAVTRDAMGAQPGTPVAGLLRPGDLGAGDSRAPVTPPLRA
eukprot:3693088-Alexandrium_andersonii.AAC.1